MSNNNHHPVAKPHLILSMGVICQTQKAYIKRALFY